MSELALFGGTPVLPLSLPPYASLGKAEADAVAEVVRSGCLSGFYGSWGAEFLGGPRVKAFEKAWAGRFEVAHAVAVNSATSGLFAAMGAIGLSPGDEVIVPPLTMSATVMAPLVYGGIPVFADIEPDGFGLDPVAVEAAITTRTKAVLAVNLFGHPARLSELRALADRHGLFLVEDCAQAPLATEGHRLVGCVGHIGVHSLNYHKHIHTGEGGMCVTDDDTLARRLQLIRNHGENVVEHLKLDPANLIGFNYRMTELSAAVGLVQLDSIDAHVGRRERWATALSNGLRDLEGVTVPMVRKGCRHVYYVWALRVDPDRLGVERDRFSEALTAEGFPNAAGYVQPLYHLPVFQQRRAFGRDGWPFTLSDVTYPPGLCPVAEALNREFILFEPCAYALDEVLVDALVTAVRKVHAHRRDLCGPLPSSPEGEPR